MTNVTPTGAARALRDSAVIDYEDELVAVIRHDARDLPLEDESVDLICCSPPYFALRSYRDDGEHYAGQIGSEETPDQFLDALDECMVEWRRVLKPSGSVWINLGDKYAGSQANSNWGSAPINHGAGVGDHERLSRQDDDLGDEPIVTFGAVRSKSLMGLPWRFAIRQIDAGWILRAEVVWDKPNGLPESVTDRVRRSHEQWFHFVREPRYFSGVDEIREPQKHPYGTQAAGISERRRTTAAQGWSVSHQYDAPNPLGRLPGSVWTIPSEPLLIPDDTRQALDLPDHFAAFPQEFPRRIVLGWSPTGICTECGEGRRPVVDVDWSKVPHEMVEKPVRDIASSAAFVAEYREWCQANDIAANRLDEVTGSTMASPHWMGNTSQPQIPTPNYWAMLRAAGYAPGHLDHYIDANELVPVADLTIGLVDGAGRHRNDYAATLSSSQYQTVTGYACACPTPDAPTMPSIICDPFGGTGTTAGVAKTLGRFGISNDLSASYNRLAIWRIRDSGHFTKTEQRSWADRQGQLL